MTTELEKQFFSTFGIKKRLISPCKHLVQNMYCDEGDICRDTYFNPFPNCVGYADCREDYKRKDERYPTITDRHYLELICALNNADKDVSIFNSRKLDRLKDEILFDCIEFFEEIGVEEACQRLKHQVQAIFKEKK